MEKITDALNYNYPRYNTVSQNTTVKDALYKMYYENVDYLIVMDNDQFVGLLSEHDVAGKVLFTNKPLQKTLVKEFMTTDIPVISIDDAIEYGIQLLEQFNARYLAVYEDFNFINIISGQDLIRLAFKERHANAEYRDEQQKHLWHH